MTSQVTHSWSGLRRGWTRRCIWFDGRGQTHFSHWDEAEPTKQVVNGVQRSQRRACGMMFHMIKKKALCVMNESNWHALFSLIYCGRNVKPNYENVLKSVAFILTNIRFKIIQYSMLWLKTELITLHTKLQSKVILVCHTRISIIYYKI